MDTSQKVEVSKTKNLNQLGMFLTSKARKAFTKLRQMFIKAPILNHFDPKYYIQIETNISCYAMGKIFSQWITDNLGQWHLVAFFP